LQTVWDNPSAMSAHREANLKMLTQIVITVSIKAAAYLRSTASRRFSAVQLIGGSLKGNDEQHQPCRVHRIEAYQGDTDGGLSWLNCPSRKYGGTTMRIPVIPADMKTHLAKRMTSLYLSLSSGLV
jgi:hypothetical protein